MSKYSTTLTALSQKIIWLLLLGSLAGATSCNQRSIQPAVAITPLSTESKLLTPALTPPLAQSIVTPRSQTAEAQKAEEKASASEIAAAQAQPTIQTLAPGLDPCGLHLALVAEKNQPRQRLHPTTIPVDFAPEATLPALERLFQAPSTVGLAAFEVGKEDQGVYLNADVQMPLASVVKIVNLIAYANAVANSQLDPGSWIPVEELDRYYLPGMDLGAHRQALNDLEEKSLIARDPPSVPLEEVPVMMIQHSSNAAADYLHMAIGQDRLELTAQELGLESQTALCPWIGQFLAMSNHEPQGNDWLTVNEYIKNPAIYGQEVMRLSDAYINDSEFRNDILNSRGRRARVNVQALFSENLNAQATPRDYAELMTKIIKNELKTSFSNILVRRVMEWPMIFPANQELFSTIGFKNGSLPGILTVSYYAQRLEDGAQIVVVLFFRDLPMQTYRNWRQSLTHDELARWLLADPEAIPELKSLLDQAIQ